MISRAQNRGTVPEIFSLAPKVPAICVSWDDFGTAKILGTRAPVSSVPGSVVSLGLKSRDFCSGALNPMAHPCARPDFLQPESGEPHWPEKAKPDHGLKIWILSMSRLMFTENKIESMNFSGGFFVPVPANFILLFPAVPILRGSERLDVKKKTF